MDAPKTLGCNMTKKIVFSAFWFFALILPLGSAEEEVKKEEPNFQYQTIKTKEGLTFRVPVDMPIEVRGGIQAPIPFDEYGYGKFSSIDRRLSDLTVKLDHIEKILEPKEVKNSPTKDDKSNVLKSP